MKIVYDKKYLEAMKRRQELDQMIQKFSNDGCLLVEDLFQDYLADYDSCDFERSYAKLAVTFYDELGTSSPLCSPRWRPSMWSRQSPKGLTA